MILTGIMNRTIQGGLVANNDRLLESSLRCGSNQAIR